MKNLKFNLIIILLILSCSAVLAQSRNKSKKKKSVEYDRGATYEIETSNKNQKRKKKAEYSLAGQYDKKVEEFYERMEANTKKHQKMAKEMEKPQYSDPSYFGHKRKPKKRPPGKKKFCKECGMYH